MTTRKERRRKDSTKKQENGQKSWMLWGGVIVVVIAIAIVAGVAIPRSNSGTADEALLTSGGLLIGDPNAPVTLVEFADFQ